MQYTSSYLSPLGELLLACDDYGLTGLWFKGQKYFAQGLGETQERETAIFSQTKEWLDIYFSGREPGSTPPLHLIGTDFRVRVWELLLRIPYGQLTTYGELSRKIAAQSGLRGMSAQAVGGAVGHNPISLIVPCHRVVGSDGSMTGYAGGIDRKTELLRLEGAASL